MNTYTEIDRQIHQASQILAKLGRSLVPKKDDDSHTNLYWEPIQQRLLGRWISISNGKIMPALYLRKMSFQWLDQQMEVINDLSLLNKNYLEAEILIEDSTRAIGIEKPNLMAPLHFEIPDYPFIKLPIEKIEEDALAKWSCFRSLANYILKDICQSVQKEAETRIWPHHFDTGIFFQWNDTLGIGAGLAMEDNMAGASYFYISGYTGDHQIDYSKAAKLSKGKWIKDGQWRGGILPIDQLGIGNDVQILQDFYRQSLGFLLDR